MASDGIDAARALAKELLAEKRPRRWRHVQGVTNRADQFASGLTDADRDTVVAAAWLHDIGYAPRLARTGFHPLDGARFLPGEEFDRTVVQLVAHRSGAEVEDDERAAPVDAAGRNPRTAR